MTNVFIYTTPHPAHQALADSIKCVGVQTDRSGIAKTPFVGRLMATSFVYGQIKKYHPKIILTESVSTDLLAGAYYKSKNPTVKLIGLVTDPKVKEMKGAPLFDNAVTMWALDKADLLFVGSQMMFDMMPAIFKYKTKIFHPGIENINKYLKKSAVHGPDFVFIGRLDDYKGTDLLPTLFNRFKHISPRSKLYVAGDGPNVNLFKDKIIDGLYYIGKTPDSLFMSEIASIYISAARFEPSGVAIIEAMAQGIVPIVTEGVGYKEFVRPIDSRLVVTREQDATIIAEKLIRDKKFWTKLSLKCKDQVRHLTYKNSVKEFKSILKENNII